MPPLAWVVSTETLCSLILGSVLVGRFLLESTHSARSRTCRDSLLLSLLKLS